MEVLSGWGMDTDSRLYFRKNYAKYEFFRKPLVSVWSCFSSFYFWYDPVHLRYCNHWRVYFIIVGVFPRSHGFHIPWNERDHGSFPAHTGTRCSNLWCSFIPPHHQEAFVRCKDLFPHLSPLLADVPKVQQLSRDPRSPPCQGTEQEILEEVLLHSTAIRALFLQQGNFQG